MRDKVYQVVLTYQNTGKIINLGIFRTKDDAMHCMYDSESGEGIAKTVWELKFYHGEWDGVIDDRDNLARQLIK